MNDNKKNEIKNTILLLSKNSETKSMHELMNLIQSKYEIKKDEFLDLIIELENENKITLNKYNNDLKINRYEYLKSNNATWFWLTIFYIISILVIIYINYNNYIYSNLRIILIIIYIIYIPGYSLTRLLFPMKKINLLERIMLSMGCSLILTTILGLLLNYTFWGINIISITITHTIFTILLCILAIYREYYLNIDNYQTILSNQ